MDAHNLTLVFTSVVLRRLCTGTILKILMPRRAPSSDKTQPMGTLCCWRFPGPLRHAYEERFSKGVPGSPDLPARSKGPTLQKRIDELKPHAVESMGIERNHAAARHCHVRARSSVLWRPTGGVPLHGPHTPRGRYLIMGQLAESIMLAAQQYGVDSAARRF